ncbi:hypothetical protein QIW46_06800 [Pseudomonas fluorescens]|uniref:hypothetical protein n=1 Tax=Pseudomonas fluorescens TaxID=294 RepID=UPI00352607D2
MSATENIKQLSTKNRHRLRAMLNLGRSDGMKVFNIIRKSASAREIYHAELVLGAVPYQAFKVAETFPRHPQVKEHYHRLTPIELKKQLAILELHAKYNLQTILRFCESVKNLNSDALTKNSEKLDISVKRIEDEFGYSRARRFTTLQAATYLNITGRLLNSRFVLPGLATPAVIEGERFYSLAEIRRIAEHLQNNISLEQAGKILNCGRKKISAIINSSNIKPSCALAYSNGETRVLFDRNEIKKLKHYKIK